MSGRFPLDQSEFSDQLRLCQERIGYQFQDEDMLYFALTHASGARHRLASNERLEFLGDAILGYLVCEQLFHDYPSSREGELTRIKSVVVSRKTCTQLSRAMGLDEFLILGKGMATRKSIPSSLLADVFESIVAAIYLDGGMAAAKSFIERHVFPMIRDVAAGEVGENYKSQLQQLAQREFAKTPVYSLVEETGPDHSKSFQLAAQIGKLQFAPAWGQSKKEAQQKAAQLALEALAEVDDISSLEI